MTGAAECSSPSVGIGISAMFLWLAIRDADLDAVRETALGGAARARPSRVVAFGLGYLFQSPRWRQIANTRQLACARSTGWCSAASRATTCCPFASASSSAPAG